MKRYLLINYTYFTEKIVTLDNLEKKHLLHLKERLCDAIIDLKYGTYFDPEENKWKEVKTDGQ